MTLSSVWVDLKTGAIVALSLIGTSLGNLADWLPDDISKVGTLVGMVLSVFLIRHHNVSRKVKEKQLELLQQQLDKGAKDNE